MKRMMFIIAILVVIVAGCKKQENYQTATDTSATSTSATATETTTTTTGTVAGTMLSDKDKDFVTDAGKGGKGEVELAQDAVSHASNADVKAFAQKLIDDHGKANQELAQLAATKGVTIPTEMVAKMKEAKERLMKLTGKSFDQAFIKQMVEDHTNTIKMFEDEAKIAGDSDVKSFIDKTLPTLREHLKRAKELETKLGKK
jgi:putative membrane protein